MSYRELYTFHFQRIKAALHFHSGTLFMPSAEGRSVAVHQSSSGLAALHPWLKEEENRERRHECGRDFNVFRLDSLRQMCCTWSGETPQGEAYCRQLSGRFLGIAWKCQRPCIRKWYQDGPWRKEGLSHSSH